MTKAKYLIIAIFAILLLIPNVVNATDVSVTRNIYSNNGSMKFEFKGLTLDTTHEYEFGLTKTAAAEVGKWHLITEYTETTASIDITTTTKDLRDVINVVDTGYITIKDKTTDTVVLQPYSVNLKTPYLRVANYTVLNNGKQFNTSPTDCIQIALRCASNSEAYYQYEKITDTSIINKYKEIKSKNGDVMELEGMLKTNPPSSNWTTWEYWNGNDYVAGMNGFGYPQSNISVPENGLYYMWIYFSGTGLKNIYGYILVDNLNPDIALEGISLPSTKTLKLGETLTLTPTFNPNNATNKIVTWTSSDESIVAVDNAGKITGKKVGSAIITVTTQDGNKKATCTVTVVNSNNNTGTEDTKQYLSFPYVIFNGTSSITVKNYTGSYKLYYQFVEVTDKKFSELTALKEEYKNSKITYAEFLTKYKQTLPQYNEKDWVETKDGKFEKDLSGFTGTKKFALWGKLVMDTKTVYEAEIYSMDGSGKASNIPNKTDKITDNTKATGKLPQTGIGMGVIVVITITALCGGYAFIRTNKLRDI